MDKQKMSTQSESTIFHPLHSIDRPIQCILFDCDGVLVDSELIASKYFSKELSQFGIPLSEEEVLREFTGKSTQVIYSELERLYQVKFAPADIHSIQRTVHQKIAQEAKPVPGVIPFLNLLKERGSPKYALASSGSFEKIHGSLKGSALEHYFTPSQIFSAQLVSRSKPDPDLFLYAAKEMGVLPHHCLVIEDSVSGIKAAQAAGMPVVAFAGGSHAQLGWYRQLVHEETGVQLIDDYRSLMQQFLIPCPEKSGQGIS